MTTATKSSPTHRAYAVTKAGEKKFWQPIRALWAHTDGELPARARKVPALRMQARCLYRTFRMRVTTGGRSKLA
jgi:hypothetical protein